MNWAQKGKLKNTKEARQRRNGWRGGAKEKRDQWLHPPSSTQRGWQWGKQTGSHPKLQTLPCMRHTQGLWQGMHRLRRQDAEHPLPARSPTDTKPTVKQHFLWSHICICLCVSLCLVKTSCMAKVVKTCWASSALLSYISAAGKQAVAAPAVLCRWPRCWNHTKQLWKGSQEHWNENLQYLSLFELLLNHSGWFE